MKMSFFKNDKSQPKPTQICVPLVAVSLEALREEAKIIALAKPDLVEWRVDQLLAYDFDMLEKAKAILLKEFAAIPLLLTWRTHRDGGVKIADKDYLQLLSWGINSGAFALVDVEFSAGESICQQLVSLAKKQQVETILSYHNFEATPEVQRLESILAQMRILGADAGKIAVMPSGKSDVLALMAANLAFNKNYPHFPSIAIAMGEIGQISRISGNFFGSALTFATVGKSSAPGQLDISQVREAVEIFG